MFRHLYPSARQFATVASMRIVAVLVALAVASPTSADAYIDAVKGEAQRVGAPSAASRSAAPDSAASPEAQAASFERELEQRYRGTYLFYKQLPSRYQDEVVQAVRRGASIDEARKMVMDRYQTSM